MISNLSLATGGAEGSLADGVTSTLSGGLAFDCALESAQDVHWSKSSLNSS